MINLSTEVTVFLLTCKNNSNLLGCIESLTKQTANFNLKIIKNIFPLSKAKQTMIEECTTPYYIQLDEDIILKPNAIEILYNTIKKSNNCMECFSLYDCHTKAIIQGIKIFNHSIFKKYPYNNLLGSEFEQLNRIKNNGFKYEIHNNIIGEHSPIWSPEEIFDRYFYLLKKHKYYRQFAGGWTFDEYINKTLNLFRKNNSTVNLYAFLGALCGLLNNEKTEDYNFLNSTPKEFDIINNYFKDYINKVIILKVDDFLFTDNFKKFFDLLNRYHKIKISLGIIGKYWENPYKNIVLQIEKLIKENKLELYNHSYYHISEQKKKEFKSTSLNYQIESINKTQNIIKNTIDYTIKTFGAVSNVMDENTLKALKECKDISHIYLYPIYFDELYINMHLLDKKIIDITGYSLFEFPIDSHFLERKNKLITPEQFIREFENNNQQLLVYQIHPQSWSEDDFDYCKKILDYLIFKKQCEFIFPTEL